MIGMGWVGKMHPHPKCVGGKFDAYVLLVSAWLYQRITKQATLERPEERARWGRIKLAGTLYLRPVQPATSWFWGNS